MSITVTRPSSTQLLELLARHEGGSLEFKREVYHIERGDPLRSKQRDELIKDILGLANGNATVAGEPGHLIIGAGDLLEEYGTRAIFDVGDVELTAETILKIVNAACNPAIEMIYSDKMEIEGKRVIVITIPPSPHLHEVTRHLDCSKKGYSEYSVLVRHDSHTAIASSQERDAIHKIKRIRFNEKRRPPPVVFGAFTGATIGAMTGASLAEGLVGRKEAKLAGGIVGGASGGLIGGLIGYTYENLVYIRSNWHIIPPALLPAVLGVSGLAGIAAQSALHAFRRKRLHRNKAAHDYVGVKASNDIASEAQ